MKNVCCPTLTCFGCPPPHAGPNRGACGTVLETARHATPWQFECARLWHGCRWPLDANRRTSHATYLRHTPNSRGQGQLRSGRDHPRKVGGKRNAKPQTERPQEPKVAHQSHSARHPQRRPHLARTPGVFTFYETHPNKQHSSPGKTPDGPCCKHYAP